MRARAVIALLAGTTMAGAGAIAAPTAFAAPAKPSGPEQHVIVLLRDQHPESPALAGSVARRAAAVRSDQAPLQRSISRLGGSTTHAFTTLNAVAATLPTTSVATLRADPAVADVVPDLVWKAPRPAHESAQAGTSSQAAGSQQVCPSNPAHPLLEPEALQLTHTNSDSPTRTTARSLGYRRRGREGRLHRRRHRRQQPRLHPRRRQPRLRRLPGLLRRRARPRRPAAPRRSATPSSIAAQGRQAYDLSTFVNPAHPLPAGLHDPGRGHGARAPLVGLKVFGNARRPHRPRDSSRRSTTPSTSTTSTCSTSPSAGTPTPTRRRPDLLFNGTPSMPASRSRPAPVTRAGATPRYGVDRPVGDRCRG